MSQIGVQSEAFLQLHKKLQPILQRLMQQRSGPQRMVALEMEAYSPGDVAEMVEGLRSAAQKAVDRFGAGVSQIVLTEQQVEMIRWTLARE